MPETKALKDWEVAKGYLVRDAGDLERQMTEEEFDAIPMHDKHGVDHEARTEFLTANGYEVTRANMIDPDLSARAE